MLSKLKSLLSRKKDLVDTTAPKPSTREVALTDPEKEMLAKMEALVASAAGRSGGSGAVLTIRDGHPRIINLDTIEDIKRVISQVKSGEIKLYVGTSTKQSEPAVEPAKPVAPKRKVKKLRTRRPTRKSSRR